MYVMFLDTLFDAKFTLCSFSLPLRMVQFSLVIYRLLGTFYIVSHAIAKQRPKGAHTKWIIQYSRNNGLASIRSIAPVSRVLNKNRIVRLSFEKHEQIN